MGELAEYFKEKYTKSGDMSKELMNKQKVKNNILSVCDEFLVEPDDILVFEVLKRDLPHAVEVIFEEPLISKYSITQTSDTLFNAQLLSVDLDL